MKCPYCNAEIKDGKICEYCGSQITVDMILNQEQLNKKGCPKCGSTNISFNREQKGTQTVVNGTAVIVSTIGVCNTCGYAWDVSADERKKQEVKDREKTKEQYKKIWWVVGWIMFFPIPLTIIINRALIKKKVKPIWRFLIFLAMWVLFLAFSFFTTPVE